MALLFYMDAGDAYTTNTCPLSTEMTGLCYQATPHSLLFEGPGSKDQVSSKAMQHWELRRMDRAHLVPQCLPNRTKDDSITLNGRKAALNLPPKLLLM